MTKKMTKKMTKRELELRRVKRELELCGRKIEEWERRRGDAMLAGASAGLALRVMADLAGVAHGTVANVLARHRRAET